jgi:tryptophan halogenase
MRDRSAVGAEHNSMAAQGLGRREILRILGTATVASHCPGFVTWAFAAGHPRPGSDPSPDSRFANLDRKAIAAPRYMKFVAGKRRRAWNKNRVAVGLAGGFLEPLESTSIHLLQTTIVRLARFFPSRGFSQIDTDEFNRRADFEYERIRDFLILRYKATERNDSAFWDYCRNMEISDSLQVKIDLFRSHGRIFRDWEELFAEESWLQVMLGQGIVPQDHDPLIDQKPVEEVSKYLGDIESTIKKCVAVMPLHRDYIAANCAASKL